MLHNSSLLLNTGLAALASYLDSQPFLNLTAHEYLWGYDDPLVRLASTVLPNWIPFLRLGLMDRVSSPTKVMADLKLLMIQVLRDVMLCRFVSIYRRLGGSTVVLKIGNYLPIYTA